MFKIKCLLLFLPFISSCNFNFYGSMSKGDSEAYHLEQAKIELDHRQYANAEKELAHVRDTNKEKIKLQAAVTLGKGGMGLWDLIVSVIDKAMQSQSNADGINNLFSLLSDEVFSEGEEREKKLQSLSDTVSLLRKDPARQAEFNNLACILSGVLLLPRITEGTQAMNNFIESTDGFLDSVTGNGATAAECPNLDNLNKSFSLIGSIQKDLQLVLSQISSCDILKNVAGDTASLNAVQEKINKILENADKGCESIDCQGALCNVLQLGCVESLLNTNSAVAGDGKIDQCEFIQNCQDPSTCFS